MENAITVFREKQQPSAYENLKTIDFFFISYCESRTNFYLTTICPLKEIHKSSNNPDCSSLSLPLSLSLSLSLSPFLMPTSPLSGTNMISD